MIALAAMLNNTITKAFGGECKQTEQAEATSTAIGSSVENQDALTDAVKETTKAQQKSLASFDEINKLAGEAAGNAGAAGGTDIEGITVPEIMDIPEGGGLSPKLQEEIDAFQDAVRRIGEVFKVSWELNGSAVLESAKRALVSIYDLLKAIGRAFTEAWTGGAGLAFLNAVWGYLTMILNVIADIADAWAAAFDNAGEAFFESILFMMTSWLELMTSIGEAFREVWNNGTGAEICETILRILTNIYNTIGTIYTRIQEAWEANGNGVAIWQAILDIVQTVLSCYERLSAATLEWAQNLNLEPITAAFRGLLEAINPLVEVITNGLAYAYENVLLPFGKWFLEELAPVGLELITAAIEALTAVLEVLEPLAEWLWETFLQPLAEWTGEIVIAALKTLTGLLNDFSKWVSENKTLVEDIAIVIGSFAAVWALVNTAVTAWNTISALASAATTALGAAFTFLTSPIGLVTVAIGAVVAAIVLLVKHWDEVKEAAGKAWDWIKEKWNAAGEWFNEHVVKPVAKFFSELWKTVREAASSAWDNVKTTWNVVSGWFNSTVIQPVTQFFSTMWNGIKQTASSIWEAIKGVWGMASGWFSQHVTDPLKRAFEAAGNTIKGTINGLISGVEGLINGVIKGVNWLISQLNKISFDVPDWVPAIGGKSFGINISKVSEVKLPRLAQGAVIPPNREFLAVLGDQKSGTNIEAPLETIKQALAEVMQSYGGGNADIHITVELDGKVVARNTVHHINDMTRQSGKPVLVL